MRRRVAGLAALVAVAVVVLGLMFRASGVLDDVTARTLQAVEADPGVAEGFVVVGMRDPKNWDLDLADRPGLDSLDADRRRTLGLDLVIRRLLDGGASLVALTELLVEEDLVRDDVEALHETFASGRVLPPFLDAAPVERADGRPATFRTQFQQPLAAVVGLPLAHAIVPADAHIVRTLPLLLDRLEGERRLRFLPVSVAAVLALAEDLDREGAASLRTDRRSLRVGEVDIPHDDGAFRITWARDLVRDLPGTPGLQRWRASTPFFLAEDLVAGRVPAEEIRGKLVLLGNVDPQEAEYRIVPGGPAFGVPEVWVHANAVNTLLTGEARGPARPLEQTALLLLAGLLGVAVTVRFPVGRAAVLVAVSALGILVFVRVRLDANVLVDPVHPILVLALGWAGMFAVRYAVEGRQRRRVQSLFKSYVPDTVADQLIEDRTSLAALAAGQRVDITVLFCDLRGFTAQASLLEPSDVRDLLNVYYRHMARIILDRAGTVMQYVGDEVFAIFGAPLHQDDHAERAVEAAVAMQQAAAAIAQELAGSGIEPIAYGIGVHSGQVVAAHVGDDDTRRQYSVVGDTVNVGARLCSQAGRGEVVISEDVVARLPETGRWARDGLDLDTIVDANMKGVSRDFGIHRLRW